jgi:hypothetical protein
MINVRQAILAAAVFPFLAACGGAPDGAFSSEDAGGSLLFPDGGSFSDRGATDSGNRAVDGGSNLADSGDLVDSGNRAVDGGSETTDGSTLLCCTSDQAFTRACGAGIEWFCSPPDGGAVEAVVCGSCTTLGQMCAVSNAPDAPLGVVGTIEPCK